MRAILALFVFLSLAFGQSELELAVFAEANAARERAGLRPLAFYPELYQAARAHALDMLRRGYFGHEGPGGPSLFERLWQAGVYELKVAENLYEIAGPYLPADLPKRAVEGWLNSPGHRQNLLDPEFTHGAVAVVGEGGRYVVVQEYAYRPFPLAVSREAGKGEVLWVSLSGRAKTAGGLVYGGYFLYQFSPGEVAFEAALPADAEVELYYDAGGYYQAARCPEDCSRLGLSFARERRVLPGYSLFLRPPFGRYTLAFGDEPRFLGEKTLPDRLFAPRVWRFLWLGQGGSLTHRVPLF